MKRITKNGIRKRSGIFFVKTRKLFFGKLKISIDHVLFSFFFQQTSSAIFQLKFFASLKTNTKKVKKTEKKQKKIDCDTKMKRKFSNKIFHRKNEKIQKEKNFMTRVDFLKIRFHFFVIVRKIFSG